MANAYEVGYKIGYEAGKAEGKLKETRAFNDGYEIGMVDAWECARWIARIYNYELLESLFGDSRTDEILVSHSVKSAIRKIEEYQEEREPKLNLKGMKEVEPKRTEIGGKGMMITKYPVWVEDQLKILDERIENIYREFGEMKVKPDEAMRLKRDLYERIKPFVDEKVRLISNSTPTYIFNKEYEMVYIGNGAYEKRPK